MTELTPLQIATRAHLAADKLRAGTYGQMNGTWHGCSIGCLAHELRPDWSRDEIADGGHALVAAHYGYPEWLVRLQDVVFEGLPDGERERWHVQIADAIASRKRDWKTVFHAVHAGILRISYRTAGTAAGAVHGVIDLHERAVRGDVLSDEDWSAAESAAWSAARSAARSAESAAWSAARSAESAAESAARSAAYEEIRDVVLAELERAA